MFNFYGRGQDGVEKKETDPVVKWSDSAQYGIAYRVHDHPKCQMLVFVCQVLVVSASNRNKACEVKTAALNRIGTNDGGLVVSSLTIHHETVNLRELKKSARNLYSVLLIEFCVDALCERLRNNYISVVCKK